MNRKRLLHYPFLFIGLSAFTTVQAQRNLYVKKKDGTQTSLVLSGIRKLTFPQGSVLITKNDATTQNYSFTELQYLSFTDFKTDIPAIESTVSESLNIYPCPTSSDVQVSFNALGVSKMTISITTMQGDVVYSQSTESIEGMNHLQLNIPQLMSGIYFVSLNNGKSIESKKIVIKK
jgi:hypothetical protein